MLAVVSRLTNKIIFVDGGNAPGGRFGHESNILFSSSFTSLLVSSHKGFKILYDAGIDDTKSNCIVGCLKRSDETKLKIFRPDLAENLQKLKSIRYNY